MIDLILGLEVESDLEKLLLARFHEPKVGKISKNVYYNLLHKNFVSCPTEVKRCLKVTNLEFSKMLSNLSDVVGKRQKSGNGVDPKFARSQEYTFL